MAKRKNLPSGILILQAFLVFHVIALLVLFFISYTNVADQAFVMGKKGFQIGMTKKANLSYTWPLLFLTILISGVSAFMIFKMRDKAALGLLRLLSLLYALPIVVWLTSDALSATVPYFSAKWQVWALVGYTISFGVVSTFYLLKSHAVSSYYLKVH